MTIHYHGTPISPRGVLRTLAGGHFCVSFASPQDVKICHEIGQSVMLDNGAFSFWTKGVKPDWNSYYRWCEDWLHYPSTWAIIPDVIDGTERENMKLISDWRFGEKQGAPVWHLHEPIKKLLNMVQWWHRVCFGSSGQYVTVGNDVWKHRVDKAFNALAKRGNIPWIHMLRGMQMAGTEYPFASLDSTDVARNHNRPQNTARKMMERWDSLQCPGIWMHREQLEIPSQTARTNEEKSKGYISSDRDGGKIWSYRCSR